MDGVVPDEEVGEFRGVQEFNEAEATAGCAVEHVVVVVVVGLSRRSR